MAWKATEGTFGTGPTETSNSANSPRAILPLASAVQVMLLTAWVMVALSSSETGVLSFDVVALAVQPGSFLTETEANGWSVGKFTVTLMVLAFADSLGTRKVSLV